MRWWLALAFAAVAALTAVSVAEVFTRRAESAFRSRAQELAAGGAVSAAETIRGQIASPGLAEVVRSEAARRRMSLFVVAPDGQLMTAPTSRAVDFTRIPLHREGIEQALAGRRFVRSFDRGKTIVVALPLSGGRAGALLGFASRPELSAELGIVHNEIVEAALIAVAVGAAAGLLIALLIAMRLRRIAAAASAIADGGFETPLAVGFRDELGELALTVERMRGRLRKSFADLEAERNRLGVLLERLHEGVVAVDDQLAVTFANGVAGRMLGAERVREGRRLPDAWFGFPLRPFTANLFNGGDVMTEARVATDEEHIYAIVGIPPPVGSQTAILVLTDVSERERRERAEREFVANAAHELRTPLTAISSAVEALNAGAKEDPVERERFLAVVERQTARLGRLVRAMLVLARAQTRQEALRLEPVPLRPVLEAVAEGLIPNDGVVLTVDCPMNLGALAQRDLLEQIVANLAGNAVKHVREGKIVLSAKSVGRQAVQVEVSDTGPGLSASEQERVFDRFYSGDRTTGESFGLGLAIVREAARALGGVVELESAPSKGMTVRVRLSAAGVKAA
jgi:signal transduction histidine kinase